MMTAPIPWHQQDARRLARDIADVHEFAPLLSYKASFDGFSQGGWDGLLPVWPFQRAAPSGLAEMFPNGGLQLSIRYTQAYPMIPPEIYPTSPVPELQERSQAVWHVLPDGALCLFQSTGQWIPEASISELLMKAAGWNLEYALMKRGVIERMTESGIVSNAGLDAHFEKGAA